MIPADTDALTISPQQTAYSGEVFKTTPRGIVRFHPRNISNDPSLSGEELVPAPAVHIALARNTTGLVADAPDTLKGFVSWDVKLADLVGAPAFDVTIGANAAGMGHSTRQFGKWARRWLCLPTFRYGVVLSVGERSIEQSLAASRNGLVAFPAVHAPIRANAASMLSTDAELYLANSVIAG